MRSRRATRNRKPGRGKEADSGGVRWGGRTGQTLTRLTRVDPHPVGVPLTTDAPLKVALVKLVERLNARGYQLLDVRIVNDHARQFGVIDISRGDYLARLRAAVALTGVTFA